MASLRVDVWSDIACPWCYVGKRRLAAALREFERRDEVEVVWRAFELDPRAPRAQAHEGPYARRLAAKYRMSEADAQARIDSLVRTAAGDGLELRFDRIRPGNTFDAHRVVQLADIHERQDAVLERFMRGYFTDGVAVGDAAALRALAVEAGLDGAEVDDVLGGDRFAAEVREDEALARQLGIHAVPCFVLDRRIAVSGAQPVASLVGALREAWSTRAPGSVEVDRAALACGPDGCP